MRHALIPHPGSASKAAARIEVEVSRPSVGSLRVRYALIGAISDIRVPPTAAPDRTDELWKHTCFEIFLRPLEGDAYCEFNFSPSTQWAAYRFKKYRDGMKPIGEIPTPIINATTKPDRFDLAVSLNLDQLPDLPQLGAWRVGITAIVEEAGGDKSYWSLAHPQGKPDFHHLDNFDLNLEAPEHT